MDHSILPKGWTRSMKIKQLKKVINKKIILDDINFELNPGEIIGLVGRNGTGKTTLFRTMAEYYKKDGGDILIDNQSLTENQLLKEQLFYIDDQFNYLASQTPKTLEFYYKELYSAFDSEKYYSLLKKYQFDINYKISNYSKGFQALFKVILAFSCQARYYILDEPFDGLDLIIRKKVITLILNEVSVNRCGVIISSHNLLELENIIDRALIIQNGSITKEFNLETINRDFKKIQMVFRKKDIPKLVKDNCKIIQVQGRVLIGIFESLDEQLYEEILALDPVLFDEVQMNLEDLYSSQFTDESDYQLFN